MHAHAVSLLPSLLLCSLLYCSFTKNFSKMCVCSVFFSFVMFKKLSFPNFFIKIVFSANFFVHLFLSFIFQTIDHHESVSHCSRPGTTSTSTTAATTHSTLLFLVNFLKVLYFLSSFCPRVWLGSILYWACGTLYSFYSLFSKVSHALYILFKKTE